MEDVFKELFRNELAAERDAGRQDGISIGRQDGINIGRNQERELIMKRLIAGGISRQQAAAFTGLSI